MFKSIRPAFADKPRISPNTPASASWWRSTNRAMSRDRACAARRSRGTRCPRCRLARSLAKTGAARVGVQNRRDHHRRINVAANPKHARCPRFAPLTQSAKGLGQDDGISAIQSQIWRSSPFSPGPPSSLTSPDRRGSVSLRTRPAWTSRGEADACASARPTADPRSRDGVLLSSSRRSAGLRGMACIRGARLRLRGVAAGRRPGRRVGGCRHPYRPGCRRGSSAGALEPDASGAARRRRALRLRRGPDRCDGQLHRAAGRGRQSGR